MKIKDIPIQWQDRCSGDGNETYVDNIGERRYRDDDELITEDSKYRPCGKCGEYPTEDGDDHCIANLGAVMNGCCGHGANKGYIQFDSGVIIRGDFEIERFEPYNMPYAIRPREEIFDKLKELKCEEKSEKSSSWIEAIKWMMRIK